MKKIEFDILNFTEEDKCFLSKMICMGKIEHEDEEKIKISMQSVVSYSEGIPYPPDYEEDEEDEIKKLEKKIKKLQKKIKKLQCKIEKLK